jgi:hypothetical protein
MGGWAQLDVLVWLLGWGCATVRDLRCGDFILRMMRSSGMMQAAFVFFRFCLSNTAEISCNPRHSS